MDDARPGLKRCSDCKKERPESEIGANARCIPCWQLRSDQALITEFSLVRREVQRVKGGFRTAVLVDGFFQQWLCEHAHRSERTARACADTVKWF